MRKSITIFVGLLLALQLKAYDIISRDIPNAGQLPTEELLCIFQDSEGYMWYGTEGGGLCQDDGYFVKVFRSDLNTPGLLESNSVTCITEDKEGKIWFGTKRGVYILNKKDYQIKPFADQEIKGWVIKTINSTSDGTVWVSVDGCIFRYDSSGKRIGQYPIEWNGKSKTVHSFYENEAGTIWMIQRKGGLFRYNPKKDEFISYSWPYNEYPTGIIKDAVTPYYWISTWGKGIVRFNPDEVNPDKMFVAFPAMDTKMTQDEKRIYHIIQDNIRHYLWVITKDNLYAYKVTENSVLDKIDTSLFLSDEKKILSHIMSDSMGNLWVTGYYPSSFIISFLPNEIRTYPMHTVEEELKILAAPMQLYYEKDHYWVRQRRVGLYAYNNKQDNLAMVKKKTDLSFFFEKSTSQEGIYAVRGSTIISLQYQFDKLFEHEVYTLQGEYNEKIRALHDDGFGNLWIGTTFNLYKYELQQKKCSKVCSNTGFINEILSSNEGDLYLVTETEGFWKINNGCVVYKHDTNERYQSLTIAPNQEVWIGTQQGNVYCYSPSRDVFTARTQESGLTGDVIYDIESDNYGNIWILTNRKIVVYNPEKQTTNLIHCSDPSIKLENFQSLYKDEKEEMHIGGKGGVVVFPAYTTIGKVKEPIISLTNVRVNNISKEIQDNRKVVLAPQERNVELFFSTFDLLNIDKIRYSFRYKQSDEHWNYLPIGQNRIFLTGLSKGNYEIEVRATDGNGTWSKNMTTILIQRLPAWYETWWAFVLYALIVVFIIIILIHRYVRGEKEKQRLQMEEEITLMKYKFFTNISHELRTPLTLIIAPLDMISKQITETKIRQQLEFINRNAQNLLDLVNQLLDFRKIETGNEALFLTKGDITEFILSIYKNFQLTAEEKGIDFNYHTELGGLYLFFDAGKLQKIINNLLSNALKFTREGGSILISLCSEMRNNRKYVVVSVQDSGKGIPMEELPRIFDRFHQVHAQGNNIGSGIGLHLVKEYVVLHQGDVSVQSKLGEGSTFSIYIPIDLKPEVNDVPSIQPMTEGDITALHTDGITKKILIVEDNDEFRTYLKEELKKFYIVYEAADGIEGEKEALVKEPDIIITDLMMPGIDGIELCHRIKNNIDISHIPVILLTASSNIENEKRGYKEGADAYILKPFHWEILMSRIQNLIEQKYLRLQMFEEEIEVTPSLITISTLDEQLIGKALEMIEKNVTNPEYTIEDFSKDMCMSRANLYRKIHSITGMSPTDFMKNIRLKKAAELLKEGRWSVAEIADKVGFNTPSYFTKSFKKMFGVSPTQYK